MMLAPPAIRPVPDCRSGGGVGSAGGATLSCVSLLGHYAAMDRARQFLLAAGAEALLPAPVLWMISAGPVLRYDARTDSFTLVRAPGSAAPAGAHPGAVRREMVRRHFGRGSRPSLTKPRASRCSSAPWRGRPGFLASSDLRDRPASSISRAPRVGAPPSRSSPCSLAWADAERHLTGASRRRSPRRALG